MHVCPSYEGMNRAFLLSRGVFHSLPLVWGDESHLSFYPHKPSKFAPRMRGWFGNYAKRDWWRQVCPSQEGISRREEDDERLIEGLLLVGGDESWYAEERNKIFWFATRGRGFLVHCRNHRFHLPIYPSQEGINRRLMTLGKCKASLPLVGVDASQTTADIFDAASFAPRGRGWFVIPNHFTQSQ